MTTFRSDRVDHPDYLKYIRTLPCLVCFQNAEAHHLMIVGGRGMGLRATDEWAVPLCHVHHMELHHMGNEWKFWTLMAVDAIEWAETSWSKWKSDD